MRRRHARSPDGARHRRRSRRGTLKPFSAGFHTGRDARNAGGFNRWMLAAAIAYIAATAALRWRAALRWTPPVCSGCWWGRRSCSQSSHRRYVLSAPSGGRAASNQRSPGAGIRRAVVALLYPSLEQRRRARCAASRWSCSWRGPPVRGSLRGDTPAAHEESPARAARRTQLVAGRAGGPARCLPADGQCDRDRALRPRVCRSPLDRPALDLAIEQVFEPEG